MNPLALAKQEHFKNIKASCVELLMARGPKRSGLSPDDIEAGMTALKAAHAFLLRACKAYPIDFDPNAPYGAASSAIKSLARVGTVMTGDSELFRAQKLKSSKPRNP